MLELERQALKWEGYSNSLTIVEREMNVIVAYMSSLGTQAALIGGFSFSFFSAEYFPDEDLMHPLQEDVLMFLATAAMGCMIFSVVASMLSTSLGSIAALKGASGPAMRAVVEHLKRDRELVTMSFHTGMACYAFAFAALVWDHPYFPSSKLITTALLCAFSLAIYLYYRRVAVNYREANVSADVGVVTAAEYLRKCSSGNCDEACARPAPSLH